MGLYQFGLGLNGFFVLLNRSRLPVFSKSEIAIDDYLSDQRVRVLGWRERFILWRLRYPRTASHSHHNEKEYNPRVYSKDISR